mgnify:CR=1 FL=1
MKRKIKPIAVRYVIHKKARLERSDTGYLLGESLESLAIVKVEQRQKLLRLDPETAQKIVNQTLYPQLWQRDHSRPWTESLEPDYGISDS